MQRQRDKFVMSMCLCLKVQLFGSCLGPSRVDRLTNLGRGTVFSRAQMLLLSSGLGPRDGGMKHLSNLWHGVKNATDSHKEKVV